MAHPARQVFQHIIDCDAKSSDAWLPSALSRLQSDDLGVVHWSIIAGLTRDFAPWHGRRMLQHWHRYYYGASFQGADILLTLSLSPGWETALSIEHLDIPGSDFLAHKRHVLL